MENGVRSKPLFIHCTLTYLPAHMHNNIKHTKEVNCMQNGQLHMLQTQTPEEGFDLAVKLT